MGLRLGPKNKTTDFFDALPIECLMFNQRAEIKCSMKVYQLALIQCCFTFLQALMGNQLKWHREEDKLGQQVKVKGYFLHTIEELHWTLKWEFGCMEKLQWRIWKVLHSIIGMSNTLFTESEIKDLKWQLRKKSDKKIVTIKLSL